MTGVIVSQNDHGYIIKSFGEVKGLLSFNETKDQKVGGIISGYVLFNKKGSGLALSLNKQSKSKSDDSANQKSFKDYLPTDDEVATIAQTYSSAIRHSKECIGKSFQFKIVETKSNYYVLKTVLEKKAKIAILPKPLSTAFGIALPFEDEEFSFVGYIFEMVNGQVPVASFNTTLEAFKD